MPGSQVGFDVVELEDPDLAASREDCFEVFQSLYDPKPIGSGLTLGYHRIHVTAEALLAMRGAAKYYMVDIKVDRLKGPAELLT